MGTDYDYIGGNQGKESTKLGTARDLSLFTKTKSRELFCGAVIKKCGHKNIAIQFKSLSSLAFRIYRM